MKIFLGVIAVFTLVMMIGTKDKAERIATLLAFIASVFGLVAIRAIELAVLLWA